MADILQRHTLSIDVNVTAEELPCSVPSSRIKLALLSLYVPVTYDMNLITHPIVLFGNSDSLLPQ